MGASAHHEVQVPDGGLQALQLFPSVAVGGVADAVRGRDGQHKAWGTGWGAWQ